MSEINTDTSDTQEVVTDEQIDTNDLDAFSDEFFQKEQPEPKKPKEPVVEEDVADETEEEGEDPETGDVTEEETEEESDDTTEEEEPQGGKKKNRFQDRIDELTKGRGEAERRAAAAEQKLNEVLTRLEQLEKGPKPTPKQENEETITPVDGIDPDAKNEDGTDKYPLGQFDPKYLQDMVQHTLQIERAARQKEEQQEEQQRLYAQQQEALMAGWNEKLAPAQERYPDFREKGENLLGTFESIDAGYGEYLTTTLMSMDYGPDVLYYLANNVDEATKIVNSGPAKATIALGRLEAKFASADTEKQQARPKVSKAPTPPPTNKGSSAVKGTVAPDTDDLAAFEKHFFKGG